MHHKIQNDGEQNRRWGNPARTQYNALLGQSIVLIMIAAQECGLTDK